MDIERITNVSPVMADEIIEVWEQAVRSSHSFLTEEDISFFKALLRDQYLPAVKLFVIRNAKRRIVAFMGLSDYVLEMLFVKPEEQGNGYGKALVNYALSCCRVFKVDVNEDNEKAYSFYVDAGYQVIGRDELDASGKPFPIIHLQYQV